MWKDLSLNVPAPRTRKNELVQIFSFNLACKAGPPSGRFLENCDLAVHEKGLAQDTGNEGLMAMLVFEFLRPISGRKLSSHWEKAFVKCLGEILKF